MEMLSSELARLLETLQALNQAVGTVLEVSWRNYEGNVELVLCLNSRGHLIGNYRFSAGSGWQDSTLSGQFSADQSYLGGWIKQLERFVRAPR